ncbi:1,2-dihydroxy-3-keto-5-methylthiopentene dioxygenase [Streptomyces sp. OE57]|uniref:1,2-dihydroxy-3-keto-5-methylthiopentene dioxygenase n=1 Tax=Streptomyces lacaronensis TaxID=3379885 RepID=UPI0039B78AEA
MTLLQVMPDSRPGDVLLRTRDRPRIADVLRDHSVALRHWSVRGSLPPDATEREVLSHYRTEVDTLCAEESLRLVDVVQLRPEDTPAWRERAAKAREAFLDEHRHGENEVRFFAHGTGCFYLHLADRVLAVVCEEGDLLSVPAGTAHWFDMGRQPDFCAIRFFQAEDGWIGDFTGDPLARRFPTLDDLLADPHA